MKSEAKARGAAKPRPKLLAAGIVPLRRESGRYRYLVLRAYRYWDFPKGEAEPGEPLLATAVRELEEETGLRQPRFRWGEQYYETEPYGRGKVARYYLAEVPMAPVSLPVNDRLGRPEHHEYRWVDAASAAPLLSPRVWRVLAWAESVVQAARS